MKDLKYLLAYLVPASAILSLAWQGIWAWTTVVFVFGLIPLLEAFAPISRENFSSEEETERAESRYFDWLLYSNTAWLFGIVFYYFYIIENQVLSASEWLGMTLSAGIVAGTCGINVAHELGHRSRIFEQNLAKILLLPALYQHFFVEHNRGHHKHVATDLDPASARRGENLFAFWWRSVTGGWRNAWMLEAERLEKAGLHILSFHNLMIRFSVYQLSWLAFVYLTFGTQALTGALGVAVTAFLLLETVNYLEHYGLRRRRLPSGHYEPVSPAHSWNSNHEVGRILLYELTRHSDHHFKSTRKYQILRHLDDSPQLPFGYPTAMLISLLPPLWFALMHKRLDNNTRISGT